ncbi:hypothetical protein [Faecalitalea cylindroides]|uniref:hypothetical protein n=1 Tax=Faecalitalea cylindroides TaxID=39483 RepID=UPI0024317E45|nr:hypothetical protein [Faecalitalea cylindroides]
MNKKSNSSTYLEKKLYSFVTSVDGDYQINKEALSVYINNLSKVVNAEEEYLEILKKKIENDKENINELKELLKSIS